MAAITPAQVVTITDKLAALWIAALGTDGSGYGLGTSGASARAYKKATDLQSAIIALGDAELIALMLGNANDLVDAIDAYAAVGSATKAYLFILDEACRQAGISGVSTLDLFAAHYNLTAATKWQCLLAPEVRELVYAAVRQYPTSSNVYFEVLQGATYTNGLRKLVVGTGQTAGASIDSDRYAGGFGQIIWSGAAGSGVVTVTGTWRKSDGSLATASDGTATLSGASGAAVLTPPFTGALLVAVTAIVAAAGVTAGTIYAEAKRPSGRTYPPT